MKQEGGGEDLYYFFQFDLSTYSPHSLVASWTFHEFSPLPCACETPVKGHLYPLQSLYKGPALHRRVLTLCTAQIC